MLLSYEQTMRAEEELKKDIRFMNYYGKILSEISKVGNGLLIRFVGVPVLIVKNAKIIEWEGIIHKPKRYSEIWDSGRPSALTRAEGVEAFIAGDVWIAFSDV